MAMSKLKKKVTIQKESNDFVYNPEQRDPSHIASSQEEDKYSKSSSDQEDDEDFDDEGHSNSTDDYGNTTTNGTGGSKEHDAFADIMARKLTRDVKVWRTIVTAMLLLTAVLVTVSAYFFLSNEEKDDFEQAFAQYGYALSDNAVFATESVANALETRSDSITSFVRGTDQEWPFVTMNDFEVKGRHTRRNTKTELFAFCPILRTEQEKAQWPEYSLSQEMKWLQDSYRTAVKEYGLGEGNHFNYVNFADRRFPESVYRIEGEWKFTIENSPGPWMPLWQISPPPPEPYPINFNTLSSPDVSDIVEYFLQDNKVPVMTERLARHSMFRSLIDQYAAITDGYMKNQNGELQLQQQELVEEEDGAASRRRSRHRQLQGSSANQTEEVVEGGANFAYNEGHANLEGYSFVLYPVYDEFDNIYPAERNFTGVLISLIRWDWIFTGVMHPDTETIHAVLENTCGEALYTYEIRGTAASFLGIGDLHETRFNKYGKVTNLTKFRGINLEGDECFFILKVYPTLALREAFDSDRPAIFTTILALAFGFTSLFFLFYVRIVQRRQEKVMATAARTNAIVTSLFPSNVRDRIMRDAEDAVNNKTEMAPFLPGMGEAPKKKLKSFLDGEENPNDEKTTQLIMFKTKPIADLFPETTVMFGDLVGFTAWSSVREPTQVFQLLETIYHAFDEIARRRRVFKVETVGDCYVAVVGLPDPRKDHATIMARFARDCLQTVNDLTKKLEVTLGPDTGDLQIRIGLHSGPVTAGVLRGEKSRFQLFGDTVNTAARMESTGSPSRIQVSQECAELLISAGKNNWVKERAEKVRAKGKGDLQTYWLEIRHEGTQSVTSGSTDSDGYNNDDGDQYMPQPAAKPVSDGPTAQPLDAKAKRLVDWNCDQMVRLLKLVVARRNAKERRFSGVQLMNGEDENDTDMNSRHHQAGTVLEEVREIITLPKFDPKVYRNHDDPDAVELSEEVLSQLHDYVSTIATLYRDNPFHNFEHASHVTMSVSKLLSRIVSPQDINRNPGENSKQDIEEYAWEVHKSTYGITSDPLTQFSVVYSALIHDVDHTGVPNATLVKENAKIAELYKQKSVAEQNSVDLAWDLLMDSRYSALQAVIYTNSSELDRFRQLVVNTVMATDIVDKDLKALRNARWDKAFKEYVEEDAEKDVNRKATIVIEHLIQASDVAHTMQHWHIFRKWNERLFQELHKAYREGRADTNPTEFWYKGEIGFFDFYIIPLAKKLKECGVFGVSSDEYLNYAMKNREEWIVKGEEIVEQMMEKLPAKPEPAPKPESAPTLTPVPPAATGAAVTSGEPQEKSPEPERKPPSRKPSSSSSRRASVTK